jgi:hypothetical protein
MISTPMTKMPTARRIALPALLLCALSALSALAPAARADTVDYGAQPSDTLATGQALTLGGLTATPGAGETLAITPFGLGVVGGYNFLGNPAIDGSESVTFTFTAGLATGVRFNDAAAFGGLTAGDTLLNVEGFAANGASLGTVTFDVFDAYSGNVDVSGAFRGVPLSGFKISGNGSPSGMILWQVSFTPVPPDTTAPTVTASANKASIPANNGKLVPVVVSGKVTDNPGGSGIAAASYAVVDEYGQVQPSGTLVPGSGGSYSFTVYLPASRKDADLNGRTFTITVSATDKAGNPASKVVVVTVPHDQAKK